MPPARHLWGLALRCERAIRGVSPHCLLQKTVWGESPSLLECIAELSSNAVMELVEEDTQPLLVEAALGRLLVSSAASALKAFQVPGMESTARGFFLTAIGRLHLRSSMRAWAPALTAMLLPRIATAVCLCRGPALREVAWALAAVTSNYSIHGLEGGVLLRVRSSCHMSALVHQTVACMLRPAEATIEAAVTAVSELSYHALSVAGLTAYVASSVGGSSGIPAVASALGPLPHPPVPPQLEWLVHSLLQLIYSPLLDLLAVMQHVPVEASANVRQWQCLSTSIPPVHTLPASMDPDAADSVVAMQVGGELPMGREYSQNPSGIHLQYRNLDFIELL